MFPEKRTYVGKRPEYLRWENPAEKNQSTREGKNW
jgi:hypothetical protein